MRTLLVVAVVFVGCGPMRLPGAPDAGGPCANEMPACATDSTVSYCESGKWTDYACPSSCSSQCDWSQAKAGDVCPASYSNVGGVACNDAGTALIGCRDGGFTEVACPVCRKTDFGFSCT